MGKTLYDHTSFDPEVETAIEHIMQNPLRTFEAKVSTQFRCEHCNKVSENETQEPSLVVTVGLAQSIDDALKIFEKPARIRWDGVFSS
jgi:hypothetical protein